MCSGFSPITIDLPSTGYFGNRVLFINALSNELNTLHYLLTEAIKPFEKPEVKRNMHYHPHLTLGRSWCGFTKHGFVKMKELADNFLLEKNISFTAHSVRMYYKPSGTGKYAAKADIALSPLN